jgi:proline dehydrogenase
MRLPFILARRFVAGETLDQAIPKVREINEKDIRVTLDLLGENVDDRPTADRMVRQYVDILKKITEAGLKATISIKATMLGLTIDSGYCRDNLFTLLETAQEIDQFVRIDMEGSDYTQATIGLFKEAFKEFGEHIGIVIQAYLHRTREDIPELAGMGADVRLCKGAYNEPESIALQNMDDIRAAYKDYAKVLLEKTSCPRIATHDDSLINWVKSYTQTESIAKERFEFQMLYGLRQPTMEGLAKDGYNTRIYVPFGTEWFPYFSRRLAERKENIWFVLKTLFKR